MKNLCIIIMGAVIVFLLVTLAYQNQTELKQNIEGFGTMSYAAARNRAAQEADQSGDANIHIVAMPLKDNDFSLKLMSGIELARAEINENGGVNGRKISIITENISGKVDESKNAIQKIAADKKIVAVIGGMDINEFTAMAALCEFNGILLVSPVINSGLLPNQASYKLIFTNSPEIKVFVQKIYDFLDANELENSGVITEPESTYGYHFANVFDGFRRKDLSHGYGVADRLVYYDWINAETMKELLRQWEYYMRVDNILLTGESEDVINIVKVADQAKTQSIIVLTDDTDESRVCDQLRDVKTRTYLPSLYDPGIDRPAIKKFIDAYTKKYQKEPDVWAAQGYDTLKVIAAAMKNGKSTVPTRIAEELFKIKYIDNVSAAPDISFDSKGTLNGGKAVIKYLENGTLKVLKNLKLENLQRPKSPAPTFLSTIDIEDF